MVDALVVTKVTKSNETHLGFVIGGSNCDNCVNCEKRQVQKKLICFDCVTANTPVQLDDDITEGKIDSRHQ